MVLQQQVLPGTVKANAGKSYRVISDIVTFIATGEDTGGAYAMFEVRTPPGTGVPPHIEHNDDETFYVLEGQYIFKIGNEEHRLGPGDYARIIRGTPHGFRIIGETAGRTLVMTMPGGVHEHFFAEAGVPVDDPLNPGAPDGPPGFDRVMAACVKYGIEMLPPSAA